MNYTFLPGTNIKVSTLCLGTMTFGRQNTEPEGHQQIEMALEHGINFIDTAEMYPVPALEKNYGSTENIIGSWIKNTGKRNEIVLATKIAGANRGLPYIREDLRYTPQTVRESVEKSLRRLQTDYIDLYQLHWPERKSNMFGQLGFSITDDAWEDNTQIVVETMSALIAEGKIRHFGISNETPWGLMRFLEEGKKHRLTKTITVQNPYSLVNRSLETGLSEVLFRENVGLLAYSPLGFGILTGKYGQRQNHPEARLNQFPNFTRYNSEEARKAAASYVDLAKQNGVSPSQMALAFVQAQPFVSSTIIGATSLAQLKENIGSIHVIITPEILSGIEKIHRKFPNPAP
ncbi:aldo/keto reductase [Flavobacterium pallidum]|uniref:Aldo/keto reductase n=1 Tax=Flavobacterium pallidum TaxID=2172098 RepID=A0A2S1SG00_9FLAO|nr:aldo/keto reductase [Flavobacterium pallidum]AWI25315.1 aldo/keto reductase [Flavobacterium pallidum]